MGTVGPEGARNERMLRPRPVARGDGYNNRFTPFYFTGEMDSVSLRGRGLRLAEVTVGRNTQCAHSPATI